VISPYFSIFDQPKKDFILPENWELTRALLAELAADINKDKAWLTASVEGMGGEFMMKLSVKAFDAYAVVLSPCGKSMDGVIAELRGAVEQLQDSILEGRMPLREKATWPQ
jgi:hypothetical protein